MLPWPAQTQALSSTRASWRPLAVLFVAASLFTGACSTESGDGEANAAEAESDPSGQDADGSADQGNAEGSSAAPTAVASAGCETPGAPAATLAKEGIDSDGQRRWWLLTAPEAATGSDPVPLVLDFHGLSEGAEFHSGSTGWSELAEREGFVVAFPQGSGRSVGWDVRSSGPNPDLDFVDSMLADIEARYCIDTSRVYSTGLSNGAFLSSVLACTRPDVFAAVGPVAGVTYPPDCDPGKAVPVISFHGTADPLLPFNGSVAADALSSITSGGSGSTTSAPPGDIDGDGYPANAADWAANNGCGQPTDEQVAGSVVRRSYDCPDGAEVVFYMIQDGGHTWPGSDALTAEGIARIVGPTNMEIDATELTWEFFARHQLAA